MDGTVEHWPCSMPMIVYRLVLLEMSPDILDPQDEENADKRGDN